MFANSKIGTTFAARFCVTLPICTKQIGILIESSSTNNNIPPMPLSLCGMHTWEVFSFLGNYE